MMDVDIDAVVSKMAWIYFSSIIYLMLMQSSSSSPVCFRHRCWMLVLARQRRLAVDGGTMLREMLSMLRPSLCLFDVNYVGRIWDYCSPWLSLRVGYSFLRRMVSHGSVVCAYYERLQGRHFSEFSF